MMRTQTFAQPRIAHTQDQVQVRTIAKWSAKFVAVSTMYLVIQWLLILQASSITG